VLGSNLQLKKVVAQDPRSILSQKNYTIKVLSDQEQSLSESNLRSSKICKNFFVKQTVHSISFPV